MTRQSNAVRALVVGICALALASSGPSWAALEDDIQEAATAYGDCVKLAKVQFEQASGDGQLGDSEADEIIDGCASDMDALVELLPQRYRTTVPDELEAAARSYLKD